MKSLLLLSFAIASLGASAMADTGDPAPPPRSIELSVLTYNVHGLPWPAGQRRGAALKAIGRELARMRSEGRQPDIVLIQEGFLGQTGALARISGYRYWAQGPTRGERPSSPVPLEGKAYRTVRYHSRGEGWGKFASAGLYILSDAPILEVDTTPFHYCAGLDCLANKGVMLTRIAIPGVPGGVDVVNTHMNSRGASKTPPARSLQAHNLQVDELDAFITDHRNAESPLLVGGDFNVRQSAERYDHDAATRPYAVVSEYCAGVLCDGQALGAEARPWLNSQDLQAFASVGPVDVRPIKVEAVFASPATGGKLSDHDGYLVHYRLSWTASPPGAN
ncbi:MAG: endonuclease/exonuclease/phosphatase family protein [Caulobacteraceae bacterium]